ncbi:MAG: alpha-L-fucosidase [Candidatus Pseudobacter hemicellulosilyticus]|uniref:alpha-L-fucosidase n=1 Tax=Candidatus Pseudobacter hemicellulosilyticus TaxID=3121375 RepID=A0AAJ6BI07_9BACT|nr:MAG: alpha-L-fucosidase [Pseudobacter sp.]
MKQPLGLLRWLITVILLITGSYFMQPYAQAAKKDPRMDWWRDARFGLFIHWGLYAVPAGEWNGKTDYGEWIRDNAQIPLSTYDTFRNQFNPVRFNASEWVKLARQAGMRYIVFTSKHHDGFALWDSQETDFDIGSTPFQRDVLKELAAACKEQDMPLCLYHSIMDWHHPDYLPRREWEQDRPTDSAIFDRYVAYLKAQLKELLTNYGPIGILWFDGEWEDTWTHERGKDLYNYVRSLQPNIIINNRVDKGRMGWAGMTKDGFAGDYGTPEQEIPATGLPGVDWESCMTMNTHWGYNKTDNNYKPAVTLIRNLVDITSKGGNFLLNVGPTAEGVFPASGVERLQAFASWMQVNGEAIHGAKASPFKDLGWGRCTQKAIPGGTRLYLHIFNWPADGRLRIPGFGSSVVKLTALNGDLPVTFKKEKADLLIELNGLQQDPAATVLALDIKGKPVIYSAPAIQADASLFVDQLAVKFTSNIPGALITYTTNGSDPTAASVPARPLLLKKTTSIKAAAFLNGRQLTPVATASFEKVTVQPALAVTPSSGGLEFLSYEGNWTRLPNFDSLSPAAMGTVANFDISMKRGKDEYAFVFEGYINIPFDAVYTFALASDDGSRLYIDSSLLIDNDGMHSMLELGKDIALGKGYHHIKVQYFENNGGDNLELYWKAANIPRMRIPDVVLYRK